MSHHLSLVPPPRNRLLRIVTRCGTLDEFIAFYGQYTTSDSILLHLSAPDVAGEEQAFSILLADGSMVMTGRAMVTTATDELADGRTLRGLRLELVELDEPSRRVHQDLLAAQFADLPTHLWKERVAPREPGPAALPLPLPPAPTATPTSALHRQRPPTPAPAKRPTRITRRPDRPRRMATVAALTVPTTALAGFLLGYLAWCRPTRAAIAAPAPAVAPAPAAIALSPPPPPVEQSPPAPEPPIVSDASSMPAAVCTATVTSKPRGARVTWNGQRLGSTPLRNVEVPCGPAVVVWKRRGYRRARRELTTCAGEPIEVSRRLRHRQPAKSKRERNRRRSNRR